MTISYVGGVSSGRAGSTSTTTQSLTGLTGGSNSSPSTGDLVVVWCSVGTASGYAPSGLAISGNNPGAYTTETMQSQTGVTNYTYAQVSYKIMGATPDTQITIPSSGDARNGQSWAVHVFRGVDSGTIKDVAYATATGTATGRPNPASVSPATAGAWILWLGASAAGAGATYTAPTDFATNWKTNTRADTYDSMLGAGYYTGWASGTYDPAAISAGGTTGSTDSWVAGTLVLRPVAAVTHATSGTLGNGGGALAGSASSATTRASTGILANPGATLAGSTNRTRVHDTTSVLANRGAAIVGAAD